MGDVDYQADVVVLGAGPAGLAAAAACRDQGVECVLLERGPDLAERHTMMATTVAEGIGGAGLYSDGKFSFFPSATRLWALEPLDGLTLAYRWVTDLIADSDIPVPAFPSPAALADASLKPYFGSFLKKSYPSFYMPPNSRRGLIEALRELAGPNVHTNTDVTSVEAVRSVLHLICSPTRFGQRSQACAVGARHLILANGRFGSLSLLDNFTPCPLTFRRLEVGIRIEQSSDEFFLRDDANLDPKLLFTDSASEMQWRTFCCCRRGEVIEVVSGNLLTVSGRADTPATERSNIGFTVRLLNERAALPLWHSLQKCLLDDPRTITFPIDGLGEDGAAGPLGHLFGFDLARALTAGFNELIRGLPADTLKRSTIYAPAIEGVGLYPDVDESLRLRGLPVWVAGDAAGLFRGLVAALVSGYFVGRLVARSIKGEM
jgi:uncharacterized FAD-dependent dehydrogenase